MTSQYPLYLSGYADAHIAGIRALLFDSVSGQFTERWASSAVSNPSFIILHPSSKWLYAVSEMGQEEHGKPGEIWALDISNPDAPQTLNFQQSGGDYPCHLCLDTTGKWIVVSNYGSGSIGVLPILPDGGVGPISTFVQHEGKGHNPERQAGPHAHSTIFTPDNQFLIAADLGLDQLLTYRFNHEQGSLKLHQRTNTPPGAGPRHMVFHPNGKILYLSCELDNTVIVYRYDAEQGLIQEQQILKTIANPASESAVADIHISPISQQLYISNRGDDTIAVFQINEDGKLEEKAYLPCGGHWPRNFAIAPGAGFILVANQYSNDVSVLSINKGAEKSEVKTHISLIGASCIQFDKQSE